MHWGLTCQGMSRAGEPWSPRPCSHLPCLTNRKKPAPPPVTDWEPAGCLPSSTHPLSPLLSVFHPPSPSIQLAQGYLNLFKLLCIKHLLLFSQVTLNQDLKTMFGNVLFIYYVIIFLFFFFKFLKDVYGD